MTTFNAGSSSSHVISLAFQDFEQMEAAIANADVRLCQLRPGKVSATLHRAQLPQIMIQVGCEEAGLLSHASGHPHMYHMLFALECEDGVCCNAYPMQNGGIAFYRPGAEHFACSTSRTRWFHLAAPVETFRQSAAAITGSEPLDFSENCRLVRSSGKTLRALRDTLCRAASMMDLHPATLENEESRRGLQQTLLSVFAQAVGESGVSRPMPQRPGDSHARVISNALEYLEANLHQPVYIADLCAATRAGERTLRNAFREFFGLSPVRYLAIRRLNQAHRALRRADRASATVGSVAARFGFWDMGRFAVQYKALFGQPPSRTLRDE